MQAFVQQEDFKGAETLQTEWVEKVDAEVPGAPRLKPTAQTRRAAETSCRSSVTVKRRREAETTFHMPTATRVY